MVVVETICLVDHDLDCCCTLCCLRLHKLKCLGFENISVWQEGRGIGLANKVAAYALQDGGLDTVDANRHLGFDDDLRSYEAVEHILADMGIKVRSLFISPEGRVARSFAFRFKPYVGRVMNQTGSAQLLLAASTLFQCLVGTKRSILHYANQTRNIHLL